MKNVILIFLFLLLTNCFSYDAETSFCKEIEITNQLFTVSKVGKEIPKIEFSVVKDLSKDFSEIGKYGDVSIEFNNILLLNKAGTLKWANNLTISIKGSSEEKYPRVLIYKQEPFSSDQLNLNLMISSFELYKYLSQGEITIYFSLDGSLPKEVSLFITFCGNVTVSDTKSIF